MTPSSSGPWSSYPSTASPGPPGGEIDRIRVAVSTYFPVYETRVTSHSLVLLVHADPATLESRFDQLRQDLWRQFYIPQLRHEGGEYVLEVIRRPNARPWGSVANLVLLGLTVASTVTAGAFLWLAYRGGQTLGLVDFVNGALFFGLPLLMILGLHELAHFVMARRHHVEASLPYFIPVPPPFLLFGTFGAFISLREPIPSKKALLDIGASGPLAGFVVSVPVTLVGMFLSAHAPVLSVANCGPTVLGVNYGNLLFGVSLFWVVLSKFVPVTLVNLHPLALAGWVGLLVTAMNLLPAGQLDGGHVFRALFGDRARWISYAAVVLLLIFGVFLYQGWIIFAVLILFLGIRHPPPLNDITKLDGRRWAVGGLAIAILLTGFVIVPIAPPPGTFSVTSAAPASHAAVPPGFAMADNITLLVANKDVVAHGFVFSGSILSVTTQVGNQTTRLNGSALTDFEANSTWLVHLPNGNATMIRGGSFAIAMADYSKVDPGQSATFLLTYLNTQQAAVDLSLTTGAICASGGPSPQSSTFTVE